MSKIIPISGFPEWDMATKVIEERYLDVIRTQFRLHGFSPLETPAVERISSLSSKGGGDNEKQIYTLGRLHGKEESTDDNKKEDDTDLALRFDLTVPMARYVAEHERELAFPCMRYAIGKVWRGERAQSGRFREFYQCDIDIVGRETLPLAYDALPPVVMYGIFSEMSFGDVIVRINNRKILEGYMNALGIVKEKHKDILTLVDKLEKIGSGEIKKQALALGIDTVAVEKLLHFLSLEVSLSDIEHTLLKEADDALFRGGVAELAYVVTSMRSSGMPDKAIRVDLSIARGLDYYTGTVYETVLVSHPHVGSVCSGGRYENLVSNFSDKKFPGVGMSIGLTRLIARLLEFGIITPSSSSFASVFIAHMGENTEKEREKIAAYLRDNNICCELYMGEHKFAKQISYAVKKGYRSMIVIGEEEIKRNVITVKDLQKEVQSEMKLEDLIKALA